MASDSCAAVRGAGSAMALVADVGALAGEGDPFTDCELAQAAGRAERDVYLAGRLAAKRATCEALAAVGLAAGMGDIECADAESGAPTVRLLGPVAGQADVKVSITNECGRALAVAVCELLPDVLVL